MNVASVNVACSIININNVYNFNLLNELMVYKLFHSAKFDKELSKFSQDFKNRVDKIEDQLMINPYVGDPLGVKWFREKRIDKYRVYYIIYEDLQSVFIVAISEKKDQQQVINTIRLLFEFFREEIEKLVDKDFT